MVKQAAPNAQARLGRRAFVFGEHLRLAIQLAWPGTYGITESLNPEIQRCSGYLTQLEILELFTPLVQANQGPRTPGSCPARHLLRAHVTFRACVSTKSSKLTEPLRSLSSEGHEEWRTNADYSSAAGAT